MPPRQMKWMIPKAEFGKLRKAVLDFLERNGKANGHSQITHDGLRNFIGGRNSDLKPFAGMSPVEAASATQYFWDYLVRTKDVLRYEDTSGCYYHLPQYPPFDNRRLTIQEVMGAVKNALGIKNDPVERGN